MDFDTVGQQIRYDTWGDPYFSINHQDLKSLHDTIIMDVYGLNESMEYLRACFNEDERQHSLDLISSISDAVIDTIVKYGFGIDLVCDDLWRTKYVKQIVGDLFMVDRDTERALCLQLGVFNLAKRIAMCLRSQGLLLDTPVVAYGEGEPVYLFYCFHSFFMGRLVLTRFY